FSLHSHAIHRHLHSFPTRALPISMFRAQNSLVGFTPRAGTQVLVRGRISVYEARGEYQLIVEHLEEAGIGALKREFERLKAKLRSEEHTSELQSRGHLVCRLLLEK